MSEDDYRYLDNRLDDFRDESRKLQAIIGRMLVGRRVKFFQEYVTSYCKPDYICKGGEGYIIRSDEWCVHIRDESGREVHRSLLGVELLD